MKSFHSLKTKQKMVIKKEYTASIHLPWKNFAFCKAEGRLSGSVKAGSITGGQM
jgi:hypothetical protein